MNIPVSPTAGYVPKIEETLPILTVDKLKYLEAELAPLTRLQTHVSELIMRTKKLEKEVTDSETRTEQFRNTLLPADIISLDRIVRLRVKTLQKSKKECSEEIQATCELLYRIENSKSFWL